MSPGQAICSRIRPQPLFHPSSSLLRLPGKEKEYRNGSQGGLGRRLRGYNTLRGKAPTHSLSSWEQWPGDWEVFNEPPPKNKFYQAAPPDSGLVLNSTQTQESLNPIAVWKYRSFRSSVSSIAEDL